MTVSHSPGGWGRGEDPVRASGAGYSTLVPAKSNTITRQIKFHYHYDLINLMLRERLETVAVTAAFSSEKNPHISINDLAYIISL